MECWWCLAISGSKCCICLELLRKVSYEAMDWWDFVNDFWEISQRADIYSKRLKMLRENDEN
ncbi:MAG: hypothetical protein ABIJ30_01425 [bacterium]